MGLALSCPACRARLRVPESTSGRSIKCPRCQAEVALPGSTPPPNTRTTNPSEAPADDSQATAPHPVGRRGRFVLQTVHAEGGLGRVWLARDPTLGRQVALKELRDDRRGAAHRSRFLTEARITGQLEHPGIVPVYELVPSGDSGPSFYTMRFVRGRTLTEAVRDYHRDRAGGESTPLAFRALLGAFVAACQAVAFAHARGVVHRDLKPANIVLGDFGEAVVLDWGLAKLLGAEEGTGRARRLAIEPGDQLEPTMHGQILGTPAYMAPEQAEGRLDHIDERTDVYGLGAVLYEILTGAAPFRGAKAEVVRKVVDEEPVRPRAVVPAAPRPLEAICLKAMRKKRKARYPSARALATEVQRWLADEPVRAYREPLPRRLRRWGRRHPAVMTAGLMLALTAAAGGVWVQHEQDVRAADAARAEGAVLSQLDEAAQMLLGPDPGRARDALGRAEDRLADGSPALQQRVHQTRDDLDMVVRLENVLWLESFTAGKLENPAASAAYLEAFRAYGLDVTGADPAEAAGRIKASVIRGPLVTGLDDWIFVKPRADAAGRERLLAVVRLADGDAWRQRLRDPAAQKDRAVLERLARAPEAGGQPPSVLVHLGKYLAQAGAWEASVEVLRTAQGRYPGDFWVNYALAMSLGEQEPARADEAVGFARVASALRPQSRLALVILGRELAALGQTADAVAHLRRADDLAGPRDPPSVLMLSGMAGEEATRGRFARAGGFLRAALELIPDADRRRKPLAEALAEVEQMARLEKALPVVLRGQLEPATAAEKALFAELCHTGTRRLYAAAARLYAEAFPADPKLQDDTRRQHRYNAACAAAQAGAGHGEDAAVTDAAARAAWRKRALDWLMADLALWAKAAGAAPARSAAVRQLLTHWLNDPDLAPIRDVGAIASLPADEQDAFRKLWTDVRGVLGKVGGSSDPDQDE